MKNIKLSKETVQSLLGLANAGVQTLGLRAVSQESVDALQEIQAALEAAEDPDEVEPETETIKAVK